MDVRGLIAVARASDGEALAAAAVHLVDGAGAAAIRDAVRSLIRSSASLLAQRRLDGSEVAALGSEVVADDGTASGIDETVPLVRAAARALVAAVNGDRETSDAHVDVALDNSGRLETAAIVALVASWFVQLEAQSQSCTATAPEGNRPT